MKYLKWLYTYITNHYDQRRRNIDIEILWPTCKDLANDLTLAKAAFAYHAFNDAAWASLGEEEIKRLIDDLT